MEGLTTAVGRDRYSWGKNDIKVISNKEVEKGNTCHNESDGRFCSTSSVKVGRGAVPDYQKNWLVTKQKESTTAASKNTDFRNARTEMLKIGGHEVFFSKDDLPELRLMRDGSSAFKPGKTKPMVPHQCHWNVTKLYKGKKIDAVVTGYALGDEKILWTAHTWGLKNGKVVETLPGVKFSAYYGKTLSKIEADTFIKRIGKPPERNF